MDKTPTYQMQEENQPHGRGIGAVRGGFQGQGRGRGGGLGRGRGQIIYYNYGEAGNFA